MIMVSRTPRAVTRSYPNAMKTALQRSGESWKGILDLEAWVVMEEYAFHGACEEHPLGVLLTPMP